MPEAVASNSIPTPENQPQPMGIQITSMLQDHFEDVRHMLVVFNEMSISLLETKEDHSSSSIGMLLIHGLIMKRLGEVAEVAVNTAGMFRRRGTLVAHPEIDRDVFEAVAKLVRVAAADAGVSESDVSIGAKTTNYYFTLTNRLGHERELLEAGRLLPWLEAIIRSDFSTDDFDDASLRDRIIVEKAREGVPIEEISQALNVKRSAVERIIARLSGKAREERKAG